MKKIYLIIIFIILLLLTSFVVFQIYYQQTNPISTRMTSLDAMYIYKTNNNYLDNVFLRYEEIDGQTIYNVDARRYSDIVQLSNGFVFDPQIYDDSVHVLDLTIDEYEDVILSFFDYKYTSEQLNNSNFNFFSNISNEEYDSLNNIFKELVIDKDPFTEMYVCENIPAKVNQQITIVYEEYMTECLKEKNVDLTTIDSEKVFTSIGNMSETQYEGPYSNEVEECRQQYIKTNRLIKPGSSEWSEYYYLLYIEELNNIIESGRLDVDCERVI